MGNLNKAMLIGRLGAKPEKKFTSSGSSVVTLNLATTEYYNDKSGQRKERTEWLRVVLWEKLADLAEQYLDKGSQVYIEGRIQTREWSDKEGQKRYTTEIVGNQMQFLDSRPTSSQSQSSNQGSGHYGEPQQGYTPQRQESSYSPDTGMGGNYGSGQGAGKVPSPPPSSSNDDFIEDDVPF